MEDSPHETAKDSLAAIQKNPVTSVFAASLSTVHFIKLFRESISASSLDSLELVSRAFLLLLGCDHLREFEILQVDDELLFAKLSFANPLRISDYGRSACSYTELLFRIASDLCDKIIISVWPNSKPIWDACCADFDRSIDRWGQNITKVVAFIFAPDPESKLAQIPTVAQWVNVRDQVVEMPVIDYEALKVDIQKEWERAIGRSLYDHFLGLSPQAIPADMGLLQYVPPARPQIIRAIEFLKGCEKPVKGAVLAKNLGVNIGTLRKHYLPAMRQQGMKSGRDGYYIAGQDSASYALCLALWCCLGRTWYGARTCATSRHLVMVLSGRRIRAAWKALLES